MKHRSIVPPIVGVVGAALLTGGGFLLRGAVGKEVLAGLGINLAAALTAEGFRRLNQKWSSGVDGILNRDIQRALIEAFKRALTKLEPEYLGSREGDDLAKQEREVVRAVFQSLLGATDAEPFDSLYTPSGERELVGLTSSDREAAKTQFWTRFEGTGLLSGCRDDLKVFLQRRLLDEVALQFGEELKGSDSNGTRSWRAFQRLLLDGLRSDIGDLTADVADVRRDLAKLNEIGERLAALQDDSRSPDEPFQQALDDSLKAIHSKLDSVVAGVGRIEGKQDATLEVVTWTKQKLEEVIGRFIPEPEPQAPTSPPIPTEVQVELDKAKGLTDVDKYSEATPVFETALKLADKSGHAVARVKVRVRLAHALYEAREDFNGAERHFRDALALVPARDLGLKHNVLHGLGDMLLFSGRLDEARATIDAALAMARKSGNSDDIAASLVSSCLLERTLGFNDGAVAKLDEALDLALQRALSLPDSEKKEHAHMLAVCYINKALLCRDAGNLDEALTYYSRAEEQHRVSGDVLDAGKALLFCGEVHCARADWHKGGDCFTRALESFETAGNSLWEARALEHLSRLFATHECWQDALQFVQLAGRRAETSGHHGEQVHLLCMAAALLRKAKEKAARDKLAHDFHGSVRRTPKAEQNAAVWGLAEKLGQEQDAIKSALRKDGEVHQALHKAKAIAEEHQLHEPLADCLLDEAHHIVPPDDSNARRDLFVRAVAALETGLRTTQSPKRRAHMMGRISALYRDIGDLAKSRFWLKRAGEIFEKTGDAFGLANYHGSLAEIHRAEHRLDDEIDEYRKVLSTIEGRSFHVLAAGVRINLAAALRFRREFAEALKLLDEAEALCNRHHFKDFVTAIARNRTKIEEESRAGQAPACTLPQLLASLRQLIEYRPEHTVAYLPFWYYAWKAELLALLRSGPQLSLMVVTDDVERFMRFASDHRGLADHFLMTTSHEESVKVDAGVLAIPPDWQFPASFPFLFAKRPTLGAGPSEQDAPHDEEDDAPPSVHLEGPAAMLPLYWMVEAESNVEGEGHMTTLAAPYLPQEAIDLMVNQPTDELTQRGAVWFPTGRSKSKDPFLTDLRIGQERGVFPVYFDRLPTSDAVTACGGVSIPVPDALHSDPSSPIAARWERALLKLTTLPRDEAATALLAIPDALFDSSGHECDSTSEIEIRLFEFGELGKHVLYPAILVR